MALLAAGHFSIHPDDLDGREMVARPNSHHGELNVEFKATSTWKCLPSSGWPRRKFKGVYWLVKAVDAEEIQSARSKHPRGVRFAVSDERRSEYDGLRQQDMGNLLLPASEANTAMLFVHNQKRVVFEARTEAEAVEVQTQLQQAGLTVEVKSWRMTCKASIQVRLTGVITWVDVEAMVCASRGNNPPPPSNASLLLGVAPVTRPVTREDRSPIQSDGDSNDVVFHSKQADSFMKLGDIKGEFAPSR